MFVVILTMISVIDKMKYGEVGFTSRIIFLCHPLEHMMSYGDSAVAKVFSFEILSLL